MSEIVLTNFQARAPRFSDRLLPETAATVSRNTKLHTGQLRGIKAPALWHEFPKGTAPRRVFRVKEPDSAEFAWYFSTDPGAELVKSPLVNDAFERWYLFEPSQPPKVLTFDEIVAGTPAHGLAVGGPLAAPLLAQNAGASATLEDRVYLITFVTTWGEESAASPAASITVPIDAGVDLTNLAATTPTISGRTFQYTRIYRTIIGTSSTSFRFVADIPFGTASYLDTRTNLEVSLGNRLPDYNDPPVDGLSGARVHPSGSVVAFKGRQVYFSRPYLPHSWPEDWVVSLPDQIVAVEVIGQSIAALTQGAPALLYGNSVASLGVTLSPYPLPCAGYNSVVATIEGVYFATEDGVALASQNGFAIVSDQTMSREEWKREFYSTQLFAARHEKQYIAMRPSGRGFTLDMQRGEISTLSGLAPNGAFFKDRYTGETGVIANDDVYRWDPSDGEESDYRWRSKEFYLPKPINFSSVQIELEPRTREYAPSGVLSNVFTYGGVIDKKLEVVFRAYSDRRLVCELVVPNRTTVQMPKGFEGTTWQFEIEGQCRVHSVTISPSAKGQARG